MTRCKVSLISVPSLKSVATYATISARCHGTRNVLYAPTNSAQSPNGRSMPAAHGMLPAQAKVLKESPESAFRSRLATIWNRLMGLPMSEQWHAILAIMPAHAWQDLIIRYTPDPVQTLLGSKDCPTIFRLESLPKTKSTLMLAAVYACILKPKQKVRYLENECFLHIHSTCNLYNCPMLDGRWQSMTSRKLFRHLSLGCERRGLSLLREPTPLLEIPFPNMTLKEKARNAALVKIVEAVFTLWLGAVAEELKPAIIKLIPWERQDLRYRGLQATHPLVRMPDWWAREVPRYFQRPGMKRLVGYQSGGVVP